MHPPPKPFLPMAVGKSILIMGTPPHHLKVIYITFGGGVNDTPLEP